MLGITEVIENLYISGLESRQAIINKGIRHVINVSSECPMQNFGPSIQCEKVNIMDLPTTSIYPYFDRLTDRIHNNLQQGKKTLVHCYVGRSRSATIILAYLMKYKRMSLREAFHYLRARRHIIGPNFGFIKQLIDYEKGLFGYTSVSFVNTSFGSVPDIYLAMPPTRPRRQPATISIPSSNNNILGRSMSPLKPVPVQSTPTSVYSATITRPPFVYSSSPSLSLAPRQSSSINRIATSALPTRSKTTISNYASAYNTGVNSSSKSRPVSSFSIYQNSIAANKQNNVLNSLLVQQSSDQARTNSATQKPFDLTREFFLPAKTSTMRTVKYVPSSYNRYHNS